MKHTLGHKHYRTIYFEINIHAGTLQVGEVMDGRFEVRATHGKGVFSTVLLAKDRSQAADSPLGMVAIKVSRSDSSLSSLHEKSSAAPSAVPYALVHVTHILHSMHFWFSHSRKKPDLPIPQKCTLRGRYGGG